MQTALNGTGTSTNAKARIGAPVVAIGSLIVGVLWTNDSVEASEARESGPVTEPTQLATSEQVELMRIAAVAAKGNAWCPYSNFHVGSAVLTKSGRIFAGCNVENASYGLTICAERSALCCAISAGYTDIQAILTTTDVPDFKWPCGACTQCVLEWGEDIPVYSAKPNGEVDVRRIRELAPLMFSRKTLGL